MRRAKFGLHFILAQTRPAAKCRLPRTLGLTRTDVSCAAIFNSQTARRRTHNARRSRVDRRWRLWQHVAAATHLLPAVASLRCCSKHVRPHRSSLGAPPARTAQQPIPRIAGSPDFPLRVRPENDRRLMTFLRSTACQNSGDSVQFGHVSFVTALYKTR